MDCCSVQKNRCQIYSFSQRKKSHRQECYEFWEVSLGCWMGQGWVLDGAGLGAGWGRAGCWMGQGWVLNGSGVGAGWDRGGCWMGQGWVLDVAGGCCLSPTFGHLRQQLLVRQFVVLNHYDSSCFDHFSATRTR